ncbi:uncharacterized protein LOC144442652 [Glandiceps talaboti]
MDYKVIDGGSATELERRGVDMKNDPLWSARSLQTHSQKIKDMHRSFLESGADIIETVTYQASISGFQQFLGLTELESKQLLKKGVQLAVEARDEFWEELQKSGKDQDRSLPLVAACTGPYAVHLYDASEYTGDYVDTVSKQDLIDWHRPQIEILVETGVDIIAFDTVPALAEAQAIVQLLQEFPAQKAWISFSCKDEEHICHGEKFSDAVKVAASAAAVTAVGVNCTSPKYIEALLRSVKGQNGDKTLIVYPNSGESYTQEKEWCGNKDVMKLSEYVPVWIDAGAKWIGGCCRTTPQDICDIRQTMKTKLCQH